MPTAPQDEVFAVDEEAAADIAQLFAAMRKPDGYAPSAAECCYVTAALMADQYEVRRHACKHSCGPIAARISGVPLHMQSGPNASR